MMTSTPSVPQEKPERTIPLITPEEYASLSTDFYHFRASFASFCAHHRWFYTLSLLSICEIEFDPKLEAIAAVTNVDRIAIMLHPLMIELWKQSPTSAYMVMTHELRHLVQSVDFKATSTLIDFDPFRQVFVSMKKQATDPVAIAIWESKIKAFDDPENRYWQQKRGHIANITMDVALHEDVLKLYPKAEPIVNSFMRDRYVPYKEGNPLSVEDAEKIHLQTVLTLSAQIEEDLPRDAEWVHYGDKLVEWLAKQLEEMSEPDEPGVGDGFGECDLDSLMEGLSPLDGHEMGGNQGDTEKAGEALRRIREALERARQEAKLMAHYHGTVPADEALMGDPTVTLNEKARKILEALRIKFVRLHAPTNEKKYSFLRINRLFSEAPDLPGKVSTEKPKKQVVLVLDTSGSMCNPALLNQMVSAARHLSNRGELMAMFCCDTKLHQIDFDARASKQAMIGGGGTMFGPEHLTEILTTLKVKSGLDIVYCTDEEVGGLDEARVDRRVRLHVINIPVILGL